MLRFSASTNNFQFSSLLPLPPPPLDWDLQTRLWTNLPFHHHCPTVVFFLKKIGLISSPSPLSSIITPILSIITHHQAFFYTHPGGPWHALSVIYVPGWHSRHYFPRTRQSVIIVVFIESKGISVGIFSIFVLISFPSSVSLLFWGYFTW